MQKSIFLERYPIYSLEINKEESKFETLDAIVTYLEEQIAKHPIAKFITTFNHYEHTTGLENGEVAENIKDAKNVIFCFGPKLPNPQMLAVRPRSIGVVEMENSFVVSFLEAPNEKFHDTMEKWTKELLK